ncbi:MAG TPA: VWA domain-containing protein [Terracidiphilus sp.]|jgi:VWFA-related protein
MTSQNVQLFNGTGGWLRLTAVLIIGLSGHAQAVQSDSVTNQHQSAQTLNPTLEHRPPPKPKSLVTPEGKVKLDVVADDAAGRPVTGLQPWDFKILDNGQSSKVMSFKSYDGIQVKPDPPVEVILVLDTMNLPFQQVAFVRQQVDAFLRQNGGQLKQPVSVVLLTEAGIRIQPRPSTDGNALTTIVDGINAHVSSINQAMGGEGYVERFQRSTKAIDNIAQNEAKKPGRKLLFWVGPGWPMLNRPSDGFTETQQKRVFDAIEELSTALRDAQMTVYSVAPAGATAGNPILYQNFLKGVKTYHDADFGNLALKVLVTQTGGKIMGPDNGLVSQINGSIENANAFYRISFNPPATDRANEYHDLKVQVDKPGVTVRTTTGYYNEPANH